MTNCDFCQNKLKTNEGYDVKGVVIDKNPGIIKLTDVILDLYFCELKASKICKECLDVISKQFNFKQKLRRNLKIPQSNVIIQISKFLSKIKEATTTEFADIFTIFPEKRKKLVEQLQELTPYVQTQNFTSVEIKNEDIKVEIVKPRKSVTFEASTNFKSSLSSSSESSDSDSNYGDKKSKKRKKVQKSPKGRPKKTCINNSKPVKHPITDKKETRKTVQVRQPHRRSVVFNPAGLKKELTIDQLEWLEEVIKSTDKFRSNYSCKFCFKDLKSKAAIRYHYIHVHLLKDLTKKQVWISHKVKEGIFQLKKENGTKMTKWKCTECYKIFNSRQAIRYHLGKHLEDDFDDIINISSMK